MEGFEGRKLTTPANSRSEVWKYFGFDELDAGRKYVYCKLCDTRLTYLSNTTNMSNHMKSCVKRGNVASDRASLTSFFAVSAKKLAQNHPKAEKISRAIVSSIVKYTWPIVICEQLDLILEAACPEYTPLKRTAITSRISAESELKTRLENVEHLSVTTDHWTSITMEAYCGVTAHYVSEDWNLQSFKLEVRQTEESHTAANIADMLLEMEGRWKILEKVVAYNTDNAANITNAVATMNRKQVRCAAHSIQLSVQKGLQSDLIRDIIGKCRSVVGHFKRSALAYEYLFDAQSTEQIKKQRLKQDVNTRWNSCLDMLVSISANRVPINKVMQKSHKTEHLMISASEMEKISCLIEICQPFKDATLSLGGEKYVTCSMVGTVYRHLLKSTMPQENDTGSAKKIKKIMNDDLHKRFNAMSPLLKLAAALDPRYKALKFVPDVDRDEVWSQIQVEAAQDFTLETRLVTPGRVRNVIIDSEDEEIGRQSLKKARIDVESDSDDNDEHVQGPDDVVLKEVAAYRICAKPSPYACPLAWWKLHRENYSHLARKYLCVTATSVPCERVFSRAGGTVTKSRNRLSGKHVDDILFLNSCIRASKV